MLPVTPYIYIINMDNNSLPQDPAMLLSFVNMKLRDQYPSLDAMCDDMDLDKSFIVDTLSAAGFEYSEENRKFW